MNTGGLLWREFTVWPDCFLGVNSARHIFDTDARFAARSYAQAEPAQRMTLKVRAPSGEVTTWRCVCRIETSSIYGPSECLAVYEDLTDDFLTKLQSDALGDGRDPESLVGYVP